jgi:hypothetical protein
MSPKSDEFRRHGEQAMPKGSPQPSEQNSFLTNPCGSGKSAWLHTILADARFIDLLAEESQHHLLCRPIQNLGDD